VEGVKTPEGNIRDPHMALSFFEPVMEEGRIKVKPPMEVADEGCGEWENTLVGYFLGQKLPYSAVNSIAHKIWGKEGLIEVLSSDNGFFFFKFEHHEGMCSILDRAPWHMANRPLVLKKWHPTLSFQSSSTPSPIFTQGVTLSSNQTTAR
jgi:hypothetical protein